MNLFTTNAADGILNVQSLALGLGVLACSMVGLGVLMTRQYFQQQQQGDVDVDRDYIADDQVSWTELLRILD